MKSGTGNARFHLLGYALSVANLTGAFLFRTNLTDALLSGADLSIAKNLTQNQLDQACGGAATKLPEGLTLKPCPQP
jgi:uncharacterized protein YjbI with pentapeptide repeats